MNEDSIPVGCVPPALRPYVFPDLVATTRCHTGGERVGWVLMNKFEQVSRNHHQMPLAEVCRVCQGVEYPGAWAFQKG